MKKASDDEKDPRSVAFRAAVARWAMSPKRKLREKIKEGEKHAWTEEHFRLLEIMKGCAASVPI